MTLYMVTYGLVNQWDALIKVFFNVFMLYEVIIMYCDNKLVTIIEEQTAVYI